MTSFVPKFEVSAVTDQSEAHMAADGDQGARPDPEREPRTPFIVSLPSEGRAAATSSNCSNSVPINY